MFRKHFVTVFRSPAEGGGSAGVVPPEPETFSRPYVTELREEAKASRLKLAEAEKALKAAESAAAAVKAEAEGKIGAAQKAANDRVVRAELKTAAIKAGMVDLDGLKLADLSKVGLDEDGNVSGADELMASLKDAKPYLFGQAPGSSYAGRPPSPKIPEAKKATGMTAQEYSAAKKAMGLK